MATHIVDEDIIYVISNRSKEALEKDYAGNHVTILTESQEKPENKQQPSNNVVIDELQEEKNVSQFSMDFDLENVNDSINLESIEESLQTNNDKDISIQLDLVTNNAEEATSDLETSVNPPSSKGIDILYDELISNVDTKNEISEDVVVDENEEDGADGDSASVDGFFTPDTDTSLVDEFNFHKNKGLIDEEN